MYFRYSDLVLHQSPAQTITICLDLPELSGKTAVSPLLKSNVLELLFPVNTVARAVPEWKYNHSSDFQHHRQQTLDPQCSVLQTYSRMPMQFPHSLGLNDNVRTRNRLRHRKIRTINLPPLTASTWRRLWCVLDLNLYPKCCFECKDWARAS
jgi:hypothetical protein